MICEICGKKLRGQQRKYCGKKCKRKSINAKFQSYNSQKRRGLNRKRQFVILKGGKCSICGYNRNLAGLTFHHEDPAQKELGLNIRKLSNNSISKLKKEIDKCILVCHNCHMELHYPHLQLIDE